MKKIMCYFGTAVLLTAMLFFSCAEEERITYYDPDAPAPAKLDPVTVTVKNLPGKSVIKYQTPDDENLLYVKAVYESAPGVIREAKASVFIDTLLLEGFNVAGNYPVELVCMGKNEKPSGAISVTVSPLTPPVIEAFPSLTLNASFGGVRGAYQNLHDSELKVSLLADTTGTGNYELLRSFVSTGRNSQFTYLGLESKETHFAAYLQDRWGNRSDTLYSTLTPMFEEEIDKDTWTWYSPWLPSDCQVYVENNATLYGPANMWDNKNPMDWTAGTVGYAILPFTTTIKLGARVMLSHITLYVARIFSGIAYTDSAPKVFEVYGSDLDTPGDNLFGGDWNLLGQFVSTIPSGNTTPTRADIDHAVDDGDVFFFEPTENIPNPYLPTRFVRIRFVETWWKVSGESDRLFIGELDIWGKYEQ
ncbi:MAG: DUF4959 domain-containing protein [Prevotellaceae bacterium]|jgi:hypothetical protein|nr:DUF4959 domain-containing protein [Prevotellaceae bacterium]